MTLRILFAHGGGEHQQRGGNSVAGETEDVGCKEVERETGDGLATVVDYELWVEGDPPAEEVGPAQETREGTGKLMGLVW